MTTNLTTPGDDQPLSVHGGYLTADLEAARAAHEAVGGYLLQIGDRPASYAVCTEAAAIGAWGRSAEHLRSLDAAASAEA